MIVVLEMLRLLGKISVLNDELKGWKSVALQSNTFLLLCLNRFGKEMAPELRAQIHGTVERFNRATEEGLQ